MNKLTKFSSKWILLAFTFSVYYLVVGYKLLRIGIHGDGIQYACVARNMAEGWGTFWKPYQDDTLRPLFHEHPPLIYWIQSIFFKLFGDGIHFEAFYGFIVGIIILCCTALIWQQVRRDFDLEPVGSWWPMLLLVSLPIYVLSLAFIADSIAIRLEKILAQKRKYRIAGGSIIALFCITGVVNMFYHKGTITRRHEFYNDFYLQKILLPQRVTVSVCPEEMIYRDWLFATMQRFYRVSLSGKMNYEYLLIDKNSSCEVPANYQKINQQATLKYELYKRQSPFLMPEHEP